MDLPNQQYSINLSEILSSHQIEDLEIYKLIRTRKESKKKVIEKKKLTKKNKPGVLFSDPWEVLCLLTNML